jgi:hypothetical protein
MLSKYLEERITKCRCFEKHLQDLTARRVDGLLRTLTDFAWLSIPALNIHVDGREAIAKYYIDAFEAIPDVALTVNRKRVADGSLIIEGEVHGTPLKTFHGIYPTNQTISVSFCALVSFYEASKIKSIETYFYRRRLREERAFPTHHPDAADTLLDAYTPRELNI